MFSFSNNFANDEKGVEGAKIINRTAEFNTKTTGLIMIYINL